MTGDVSCPIRSHSSMASNSYEYPSAAMCGFSIITCKSTQYKAIQHHETILEFSCAYSCLALKLRVRATAKLGLAHGVHKPNQDGLLMLA